MVLVSEKDGPPGRDGSRRPLHSHSFDAGASWAAMALQARKLGLYAHAMSGIDLARTASELHVPDTFRVEATFALGHLGDKSTLPESVAARELPSPRRPLAETAFEGGFRA